MKRYTYIKKCAAALLMVVLLAAAICPVASAFEARIFSDSSVIYEYPSSGARRVSGYGGVSVEVTDWQNGWAKIRRGGVTGYILIRDLNLANPIPGWTNCAATIYNANGKKAGTAPRGTMVYVIGYYNGYCRVVDSSASKGGYIHISDLSRSAPSSSSSGSSSSGSSDSGSSGSGYTPGDYTGDARLDYLLYVAYSNLDKPYSSPSNPPRSFDCSSFVNYCYNAIGYNIGRTAEIQGYNESFAKIDYDHIRVGDILCFNTDTDDSDLSDHTAIYLGNDQFVHASSNGGKVQVNSFTSYYREHFSWARRVLG